jgi:lipoate-protein ligase A
MDLLDLTLPDPAANLACDEALMDAHETSGGADILRFWEPGRAFVVVGYSNRVTTEVDVEACRRRQIPVLRRCSGGGTVLQAPGCVNYSLVMRMERHADLAGLTETNRYVMERHRAVIERLLAGRAGSVTFDGHTDLALAGRKFSGNAQRRKRHTVLFHGCFLLSADLALIGELLRFPSRQPVYRRGRSHAEFLVNLPVSAGDLKRALAEEWRADRVSTDYPRRLVDRLIAERYGRDGWNLRR